MSFLPKFRVWDKMHKEWADPDEFFINADGELLCFWGGHDDWSFEHEPTRYVAQFFTGLFDVNGREIFEGDILKTKGWRGHVGIATVQYEEVSASDDMGSNMIGFPRYDEYGTPEIIGNIFEGKKNDPAN